jgi:hypothetical protein
MGMGVGDRFQTAWAGFTPRRVMRLLLPVRRIIVICVCLHRAGDTAGAFLGIGIAASLSGLPSSAFIM